MPSPLPSTAMRMARQASNRIQKLEASAGFEPAMEVLQTSARSSPEFGRLPSRRDPGAAPSRSREKCRYGLPGLRFADMPATCAVRIALGCGVHSSAAPITGGRVLSPSVSGGAAPRTHSGRLNSNRVLPPYSPLTQGGRGISEPTERIFRKCRDLRQSVRLRTPLSCSHKHET